MLPGCLGATCSELLQQQVVAACWHFAMSHHCELLPLQSHVMPHHRLTSEAAGLMSEAADLPLLNEPGRPVIHTSSCMHLAIARLLHSLCGRRLPPSSSFLNLCGAQDNRPSNVQPLWSTAVHIGGVGRVAAGTVKILLLTWHDVMHVTHGGYYPLLCVSLQANLNRMMADYTGQPLAKIEEDTDRDRYAGQWPAKP